MRRLLFVAVALVGADSFAEGTLPIARPELAGAIAGRVCRDLDANERCSADEPGVASARVVLETGQYALTDAEGRFHLAAVGSREPDLLGGGRLLPGRHRVRIDPRTLPPGARPAVAARTVEVTLAALVTVDFAIALPEVEAPRAVSAFKSQPPTAQPIAGGQVRFLLAGQSTPGSEVTVDGTRAEVEPNGTYRAWVTVRPGSNAIPVSVRAASGAVSLFEQRIDVVRRENDLLIVPRELAPTATVRLPGNEREVAAAGTSSVRVEGAPGTKIHHPTGEVTIGPSGAAEIPVELRPGQNALPLRFVRPGEAPRDSELSIAAASKPFALGLLDLEAAYTLGGGGLRLFGRGAAHAEYRLLGWDLAGELDLDDRDVELWRAGAARTLALPRAPERLERSLDPELYPWGWGDDSTGIAPNEAEGRFRLRARRDGVGELGFGVHRAQFADAEIGRYQRELFGPYADVKVPIGPATLGAKGFFSPDAVDPTRPLSTSPAHEELRATGGSVFYLGHFALAQGSEVVRVVIEDGLTRLPIAERHLVRGRDYEIDYAIGRILLARPLSFVEGQSLLQSAPLTTAPEPVLVVDYERLELGAAPRRIAGGEVSGAWGDASLALGAAVEEGSGDYRLLQARGAIPLGPLSLHLEVASSRGLAHDADGFSVSDDGGLSFVRPAAEALVPEGLAYGVRLRGPGITGKGVIDASYRRRDAGFSDASHLDRAPLSQASLRAEDHFGPITATLLFDDQSAVDPREPFSTETISSRLLGGAVGWDSGPFGARLEVKDSSLTARPDLLGSAPVSGGRTSAGLSAHFDPIPSLRLVAGHLQRLATRGDGLGAVDDTFSSVGAEWLKSDRVLGGVRVGYGPALGPQAFAYGSYERGNDTYYGTHTVDVDGPDFGLARSVFGARTRVDDRTAVFVEDVAAHDASAVRLSRAVGLSQDLGAGLSLSARYERGVRALFDTLPSLRRDAGGITAAFTSERLRLYGRGELRSERGTSMLGVPVETSRLQRVLSLGADVTLLSNLRASGRLNWVDTENLDALESLLLEGSAGISWRLPGAIVIAHYGITRELLPPDRGQLAERRFQSVSLMPSFALGDRVTLGAGAHLGVATTEGVTSTVVSGSLRPAVRIWKGLEVAGELAHRSAAPAGESLDALRGEVGYRFDQVATLALGYSFFGFHGNGLPSPVPERTDRLYLRAELAY